MSVVRDLRTRIRDFLQHPRRLNAFLKDAPNWNMLVSSFDTVADTEIAIESYEAMPDPGDVGLYYLGVYGILQCLYVQQDAVESMVRAFEPTALHPYRIETEQEADAVRRIRNKATGHPTKEGDVKSKKKPGIQMSHVIVRHSLHKNGFRLMTNFANGNHEFVEVSILKLIQMNRLAIERVLTTLMNKLEAAEMEHQNKFKGEMLADMFPETLDYFFEKLSAGVDNPTSGGGEWGGIHLNSLADKVKLFRGALEKRGLLNPLTSWEYSLAEVEYPIRELQSYWMGDGSIKDARAAEIFVYFLRDKVMRLRDSAKMSDEEYHSSEM